MTNGNKNWGDGTVALGQQFGYAFDEIGNRTATSGLSNATYGANLLNQYTNRTVPGVVNVMGSVTNEATASVNNHRAYRHGNYYQWPLAVTNTSGPVYMPVTNLAVLNDGSSPDIVATNIGHAYVPQTPESFGYDADGNLTNDGRWGYVWDAENRLISMQAISTVPTAAKMKLDFAYDYKGRRIQKVVSTNSGSAYVAEYTNVFVYDGWNMIGELNGANDALIRSYGWGLDLSGSMQGAGGVGGLIWIRTYGSGATTDFPCYDANGNVTTLVGGTQGLVLVGQNEYGPFGEPLRVTDEATNNPFRFSTKYEDTETGFLYYGYRYYNPGTGRWLSRDPAEEAGGPMLYQCLQNDAVNQADYLGLFSLSVLVSGSVTNSAERIWEYLQTYSLSPEEVFIGNAAVDSLHAAANHAINTNPKTMGWADLTMAWFLELGPTHYQFHDGDWTTERLKHHEGVNIARAMAQANLARGQTTTTYTWNYGVPQFWVSLKQVNRASLFLGSYTITVTCTGSPCHFNFVAYNLSSLESFTRLRKAATPGGLHQGILLNRQRGGPGLHLGGNMAETWSWSE